MQKLKCLDCNKMFHPQGLPNHKKSHLRTAVEKHILQGEIVVTAPQNEYIATLADHVWSGLSSYDKVTALALFYTKPGA